MIEYHDMEGLDEMWKELQESDEPLDVPSLFQKLYLHSCLKGFPDIAHWFQFTVFPTLDPIIQIALRQVFPYGGVLLRNAERRKKERKQ